MRDKSYPHIPGVLTNEGESPTVIAVHAVLSENENFPDEARIIVGSPQQSSELQGHIASMGGCSMSPEAAEKFALTLLRAAHDARIATGNLRGIPLAFGALMQEANSWGRGWVPDIDDPGTPAEMWTGKFYATDHNGEDTSFEVYGEDAYTAKFARYLARMHDFVSSIAGYVNKL